MKLRCYHCGTVFRGTVCPDCGHQVDPEGIRPSPLDYVRLAALGMILVAREKTQTMRRRREERAPL